MGAFKRQGPSGRINGHLYVHLLKSGVFYSVVTNAPFVCRVAKGVKTSVYITEFAVVRILARLAASDGITDMMYGSDVPTYV